MAMTVYKICTRRAWDEAEARGRFDGSADDARDGYIHLSTALQLPDTLARHFREVRDLMLVAVEADRLGPALRWERSRGGQLFPHLYAPLALEAVAWARPLPLDADGAPVLPREAAP